MNLTAIFTAAAVLFSALPANARYFTPPSDSPAPDRAAGGATRVKSAQCPEGKSPDLDGGCSAKAPKPGEASIWVDPGCNGVRFRAWTGDEDRVTEADDQLNGQGCRVIEYGSAE